MAEAGALMSHLQQVLLLILDGMFLCFLFNFSALYYTVLAFVKNMQSWHPKSFSIVNLLLMLKAFIKPSLG